MIDCSGDDNPVAYLYNVPNTSRMNNLIVLS